ncbi:MAG: hypothetical protein XD81_0846 [Bacteroidetes bacterium 38_7]|nr:MAG: hypothetical protein XD81_0846 [Bacteroidetes bacterium 38_7]
MEKVLKILNPTINSFHAFIGTSMNLPYFCKKGLNNEFTYRIGKL